MQKDWTVQYDFPPVALTNDIQLALYNRAKAQGRDFGEVVAEVVTYGLNYLRHREELFQILDDLSPREGQVFEGVANGQAYKQIALELGISAWTVQHYANEVLSKFNAHSMTEILVTLNEDFSSMPVPKAEKSISFSFEKARREQVFGLKASQAGPTVRSKPGPEHPWRRPMNRGSKT
jgi:DNA-binding CsgD family transcriptional regulator